MARARAIHLDGDNDAHPGSFSDCPACERYLMANERDADNYTLRIDREGVFYRGALKSRRER
jgi:hypothetical protein